MWNIYHKKRFDCTKIVVVKYIRGKIMPTYEVEVKRSYVPKMVNGKMVFNKKGKPETVMVIHRKLFIDGDFVGTKRYKVNVVTRKGETRFSVHRWHEPVKPFFGSFEWSTDYKVREAKWVKDASWDMIPFCDWLRRLLGKEIAPQAIRELFDTMAVAA